ncbi:3-deoxy-D-manno-octulosonic acid transferase [Caulobacter sp. NIBR1757]|uniref:3-deoxy-D-manno-octulosonic acid transferase n=1 Tax=Caulobacter sp. NIBR1757 TaxID=3016000 RepID=UPI0022F0380E|nr:3-deoxy-D-manno-octulosonic acid transferase [Caulobacter sp. NIBR1757]WGM40878.1 3-deoxy-D-manno-octulosonic acid transferase [Caulobacter sp. NIBR1757]
MTLSLRLYRAAMAVLQPFAPGLLSSRAAKGKEDAARVQERLGHASVARPEDGLVWIHAISVGESQAVLPLIERLAQARPDLTLLVTCGTVTAAALLAKRLPAGAIHQYAPLDTPASARRFLDHWLPDLVILVESEIWPNLILGAKQRGAKLALISARITHKTAKGWARMSKGIRQVLAAFDLVLPQDELSAERLRFFGVETDGRLNLKLAGEPLPADEAELAALRKAIGKRPVVLAASTHAGEEAIIVTPMLTAIRNEAPDALVIIAPRHPERLADVLTDVGTGHGPVAVRSRGDKLTRQTRIYLADTLGEMGLFFRLADVVVMGGSFVPGVGGHNPMEPARLGAPVISGPQVFNSAEVYEAMVEGERGAMIVETPGDLSMALAGLLAAPDAARALGARGQAFAQDQSAQLDTAWARLEALLP